MTVTTWRALIRQQSGLSYARVPPFPSVLYFSLSFVSFSSFRLRNLPIPKSHFSTTPSSCLIRLFDRRQSSLRWRRPRFGRSLAWPASKTCRSSKTGHRRVDSLRFATLAGFPPKALAPWPFSLLLLVHSLGGCIRSARATRSEGLYFLPNYLSLVYGHYLFLYHFTRNGIDCFFNLGFIFSAS